MPQPTPRQMHVDRYLTNLSVAYVQQSRRFVADKVFPVVRVSKQSDLYAIYPKGYFFRDEVRVRPLGGRSNLVGYKVEQGTYRCEERSLAHTVDDRVRANADEPLDPDRAAMRLLTTQAMIHRDRLWAERYFRTGVWGTNLSGVASNPNLSQFVQFDQSSSDPVRVVKQGKRTLLGSTGYEPNILVMGQDVYLEVTEHEDIKDRIKYTQRAIADEDILASLFGVDQVLVPGGVRNSAAEGVADDIDFIVGTRDMLLVYANPAERPTLEEPSGGYTFAWTGLLPGETNAFGGVIERMRDDPAHSDLFEIRTAYDIGLVASDVGIFYSGAVAAPQG